MALQEAGQIGGQFCRGDILVIIGGTQPATSLNLADRLSAAVRWPDPAIPLDGTHLRRGLINETGWVSSRTNCRLMGAGHNLLDQISDRR